MCPWGYMYRAKIGSKIKKSRKILLTFFEIVENFLPKIWVKNWVRPDSTNLGQTPISGQIGSHTQVTYRFGLLSVVVFGLLVDHYLVV